MEQAIRVILCSANKDFRVTAEQFFVTKFASPRKMKKYLASLPLSAEKGWGNRDINESQ
jgi:hypothetical protein